MPWVRSFEARIGRTFSTPTLGETILQVPAIRPITAGRSTPGCAKSGGEPPLVDYIAWIWFGRPASNWTPAPAAV